MRLDRKTGQFIDFDTHVGDVGFEDANGAYLISVVTDGEFWRVVNIDGMERCAGLTPKAAIELGRLLIKAGRVAAREDEQVDAAEARAAKRAKARGQ